ncbi:MAG: DUF3769 domain-containing protein [Phormidesmis sp. CAN_BIN36]|nr:DUF3769 domain-containing protein [Phormidesmis sp. CAN_BIN36]
MTPRLTLKQSVKPAPPEVLQATLADLSGPKTLRESAFSDLGDSSSSADSLSAQAPSSQPTIPQIPQPDLPISPTAPLPTPSNALPPADIPIDQLSREGFLELKADRQDYDAGRQIFTAEGNVSLKFRGALLTGDRVQVNLVNRLTVAEGNVVLTRGQQVLRGQRFRYNLIQEEGIIERASGDIFLPSTANDFNPSLPTDITAGTVPGRSVGDRNTAVQPAQQVSSSGGVTLAVGSRRNVAGASVVPKVGGEVRRVRFEADEIEFYPEGWRAKQIRLTNDPFSPPELEVKAERAQLTRLSPLRDELVATRPRLVFDQRFSLPLLRNRIIFDRNQRQPALVNFGIDTDDRGGVFLEREIEVTSQGPIQFRLTPQFLIQRAITNGGNPFNPDNFGLRSDLSAQIAPRTRIRATGVLTSLDLGKVETNLRASVRAQQLIGTHTLSLEASYRDRLFNNSLGFQDIQSSIGALLFSPNIALGDTGINLSYQVGYQYVNADTDRADLLEPIRRNNRISLGRFQASAALSRGFLLWQGTPAPATPTEGLRYSPNPVVPYLSVAVGLTGVGTTYSNGDNQNNLNGSISLFGQVGHLSRPFLDYTAFNLTYTQVFRDGLSPFLFDRVADDQILYAGITQQLYGPLRVGFQTVFNVQTGQEISTDYLLEYSRRTYSVGLRYNPIQQLGSVSLRISDFNWTGGNEPFNGSGVTPVQGGVIRRAE